MDRCTLPTMRDKNWYFGVIETLCHHCSVSGLLPKSNNNIVVISFFSSGTESSYLPQIKWDGGKFLNFIFLTLIDLNRKAPCKNVLLKCGCFLFQPNQLSFDLMGKTVALYLFWPVSTSLSRNNVMQNCRFFVASFAVVCYFDY